jgi:hypothetical protein
MDALLEQLEAGLAANEGHDFAIDDEVGGGRLRCQGRHQLGIGSTYVIAAARAQNDSIAVGKGKAALSVELPFVQPGWVGETIGRERGQHRLEPVGPRHAP